MTITWINCSEHMPPDDGNMVIYMLRNGKINTATGEYMNENNFILALARVKWTPYTKEAWEELSR